MDKLTKEAWAFVGDRETNEVKRPGCSSLEPVPIETEELPHLNPSPLKSQNTMGGFRHPFKRGMLSKGKQNDHERHSPASSGQ